MEKVGGHSYNGHPRPIGTRAAKFDVLAYRVLFGPIPPRHRLIDHSRSRGASRIRVSEFSALDDWNSQGSEKIRARHAVACSRFIARTGGRPAFDDEAAARAASAQR